MMPCQFYSVSLFVFRIFFLITPLFNQLSLSLVYASPVKLLPLAFSSQSSIFYYCFSVSFPVSFEHRVGFVFQFDFSGDIYCTVCFELPSCVIPYYSPSHQKKKKKQLKRQGSLIGAFQPYAKQENRIFHLSNKCSYIYFSLVVLWL